MSTASHSMVALPVFSSSTRHSHIGFSGCSQSVTRCLTPSVSSAQTKRSAAVPIRPAASAPAISTVRCSEPSRSSTRPMPLPSGEPNTWLIIVRSPFATCSMANT